MSGQARSQAVGAEAERPATCRLGVALHLVMKRSDGGIQSGELTLQSIPPKHQHGHLALLMLTSPLLMIGASVAAERRKHGFGDICSKSGEFTMVP